LDVIIAVGYRVNAQNIYDEKELVLDETMKKFGISEFSTKPINLNT